MPGEALSLEETPRSPWKGLEDLGFRKLGACEVQREAVLSIPSPAAVAPNPSVFAIVIAIESSQFSPDLGVKGRFASFFGHEDVAIALTLCRLLPTASYTTPAVYHYSRA